MDRAGVEENVVESGHVGPVFDLSTDNDVANASFKVVTHFQSSSRLEV